MTNSGGALSFASTPDRCVGETSGVEVLDPTAESGWDDAVASLPGATFFHTASWAAVLKAAYGYRPLHLVTRSHRGISSLLPLFEVSSWLTGRRGIALPFSDEAPALAADQANFDALYREALRLARRRHWRYLECRGGRAFFGTAPAVHAYHGHQLDLTPGETALFAGCASPTRRAVRKARQCGVEIELCRSLEATREFYRLLCLTRHRQGIPPQPFRFFAEVQRRVLAPGHGWVALARHRGTPVAGAVYFHFGRSALFKYGASDDRYQHLRANNLLMWEAIRRYAADGYATLDFGRTDHGHDGLRRFKLGWGAAERDLEYFRQELPTGRFCRPKQTQGHGTRLPRLVPLPLCRVIGAALYRHIA